MCDFRTRPLSILNTEADDRFIKNPLPVTLTHSQVRKCYLTSIWKHCWVIHGFSLKTKTKIKTKTETTFFRFKKHKHILKLEIHPIKRDFVGWKNKTMLPSNNSKIIWSQSTSPEIMPYITFSCWVRIRLEFPYEASIL